MIKKKVYLVIVLVLILLLLVGCKGLLNEEEFKGKSLGVSIVLPDGVTVDDEGILFDNKDQEQLRSGVLGEIAERIDMEVVDLNDRSSSGSLDYKLIIEVSDIQYSNFDFENAKTRKSKILDKEVLAEEPENICEVNTIYKLISTKNNEELVADNGNRKSKKIGEDVFIVPRNEHIQEAILKTLRDIVGF